MLRRLLLASFFVLLSGLSSVSIAQGPPPIPTWSSPIMMNGKIYVVRMLDAEGSTQKGVAGLDLNPNGTGIEYTTNGGATTADWTNANVGVKGPVMHSGHVTDFTFVDQNLGFASIIGNEPIGFIRTTNGGVDWDTIPSSTRPIGGFGIYYNKTNHLLFLSGEDSAVCSRDSGRTWFRLRDTTSSGVVLSDVPSSWYYTGFAFGNDQFGVLAVNNVPGHAWLRTTDGGKNWVNANNTTSFFRSWQPLAVQGTPIFYAVDLASGIIIRSDDTGRTFGGLYGGWNGSADNVVGDIVGDPCVLYMPTEANGMYASTDQGASATPIPGNWGQPVLSRAFLSNATAKLWSFDEGLGAKANLYYATNLPGPTGLHIYGAIRNPNDPAAAGGVPVQQGGMAIQLKNVACNTQFDTTIYLYGCLCSTVNLTQIRAVSLSSPTTSNFSVSPGSSLVCGAVPVTIHYLNQTAAADSADIELKGTVGSQQIDTFIRVIAPSIPLSIDKSWGKDGIVIHYNPNHPDQNDGCCKDVVVDLYNPTCSEATIKGAFITQPEGDTVIHFDVPPIGSTIPRGRYPYDIHIRICAILKGTYYSTLSLHIQGISGQLDLDVPVTVIVDTQIQTFTRSLNWTTGSCCGVKDTGVYIFNSMCEPFTVTATSPNPIKTAVFEVHSRPTPFTVGIGGIVKDTIIPTTPLRPGTFTSVITHYITMEDGSTFTIIDTAKLTILSGNESAHVQITPSKIQFGAVSVCDTPHVIRVAVTNDFCKADTLYPSSLTFTGPGFDTTFGGPATPKKALKPGDSEVFYVRFDPVKAGANTSPTGTLTFSLHTECGNISQAVGISAISQSGISGVVSNDSIVDLGTHKICEAATGTITLTNGVCEASGYNITGLTGPFDVNPKSGQLTTGQVATFTVTETSAITGGSNTGAFLINLGPNVSFPIKINDNVIPASRSYTITVDTSSYVCDTCTLTKKITITNNGICDTLDINQILGDNTISSSDTGTIVPGGSKTITITVTPKKDTTSHHTIHLIGIGGTFLRNPIDTALSIDLHVVPTVLGTLTLNNFDPVFQTKSCTPLTRTLTISSGGGTGTIDSVVLIPANGKFGISSDLKGQSLSGNGVTEQITFDPSTDTGTTVTATLIIYAKIGDGHTSKQIVLTGIDTASHYSGTISISSTTPMPIPPGQTIDYVITLDNPIPATIGMTKLTVDFKPDNTSLMMPQVGGVNPNSPTWTSSGNMQQYTGGWLIDFEPGSSGTMIPAGRIGTVTMVATLSDTDRTVVRVGPKTIFNDSIFATCQMNAVASVDGVPMQLNLLCGDHAIETALQGKLSSIDRIQIVPNPASKTGDNGATLSFHTNDQASVAVDMVDLLGNPVVSLTSGTMPQGRHTLPIPTGRMAEGTYFARIQINGVTIVRKFVLQKQ